MSTQPEPTQLDKFKAAAREAGLDEDDEKGFTGAVKRVAAHRPKNDAETEKPESGYAREINRRG